MQAAELRAKWNHRVKYPPLCEHLKVDVERNEMAMWRAAIAARPTVTHLLADSCRLLPPTLSIRLCGRRDRSGLRLRGIS